MRVSQQSSLSVTETKCYAIRRVNPFLGVLQVIEMAEVGRAVSTNGVVWDIEVLVDDSERLSSGQGLAYYRYGLWSVEEGLVNRPLAPHLAADPMTAKGQQIIDAIIDNLSGLPFKLQDDYELWLLTEDTHKPLVLLASCCHREAFPQPEPRQWRACLGANGVASQHRFPETAELEAQVKQRAGFNLQKCWFKCLPGGDRERLNSGEVMDHSLFPTCLILTQWPDSEQQLRTCRFIEWIAPSLLTLQNLDKATRIELEEKLSTQAISVEHHWHLYPQVENESLLNSARVQAQIQKAGQSV